MEKLPSDLNQLVISYLGDFIVFTGSESDPISYMNDDKIPPTTTHIVVVTKLILTHGYSGSMPHMIAIYGPVKCIGDMIYMFFGATAFNGPMQWDTSSVTNMNNIFAGTAFENQGA
jgi:hypothetical protein